MKGLMLLVALAFAGACAAPTEPTAQPTAGPSMEETMPTCRSGYAIANRNGEWVCEPIDPATTTTTTTTTTSSEP